MVTIDLSTPPPPAESVLEALPRRVALTLPELTLAARLAGDAPLPFTPADPVAEAEPLAGRLGATRPSREDEAYAAAMASLHDPEGTLTRRGLLVDGALDAGVAGAIGLLATPALALDIDVSLARCQAKAWHRYNHGAVATLSTSDGIVFELAWFPVAHWTDELARVTAAPRDDEGEPARTSGVPEHVDLPYALVDAVGEALRSGRGDLVTVLVGQQDLDVRVGREVVDGAVAATVVSALHTESHGRLRVLAAEVAADVATDVGVVSWVLLADGWHSITPHQEGEAARVAVRRVDPEQLATELAPVLARVIRLQEGHDE